LSAALHTAPERAPSGPAASIACSQSPQQYASLRSGCMRGWHDDAMHTTLRLQYSTTCRGTHRHKGIQHWLQEGVNAGKLLALTAAAVLLIRDLAISCSRVSQSLRRVLPQWLALLSMHAHLEGPAPALVRPGACCPRCMQPVHDMSMACRLQDIVISGELATRTCGRAFPGRVRRPRTG
jgi:hypothetical protein